MNDTRISPLFLDLEFYQRRVHYVIPSDSTGVAQARKCAVPGDVKPVGHPGMREGPKYNKIEHFGRSAEILIL